MANKRPPTQEADPVDFGRYEVELLMARASGSLTADEVCAELAARGYEMRLEDGEEGRVLTFTRVDKFGHFSTIIVSNEILQLSQSRRNPPEPFASSPQVAPSAERGEGPPDVLELRALEARRLELVEQSLGRISTATQLIEETKAELQSHVEGARSLGASWADIGRAAGITPPSAMRRWDPEAKQRRADYQRRRLRSLRGVKE